MNMTYARTGWIAGAFLALSGCSTVHYGSDFDSQAPFSDLQTYRVMLPNEDERAALERVSPFLERRLERALHAEMAERGYVEAVDGEPSFWISAYPVLPASQHPEDGGSAHPGRTGHVGISFGFGVGPPWGYPGSFGYPYHRLAPVHGFGPWYGYGPIAYPAFGYGVQTFGGYGPGGVPGARGIYPGTIVVDVTDAASDELVWQGWAENALQGAPEPRRLDQYVDEVVRRILRDFPPADMR